LARYWPWLAGRLISRPLGVRDRLLRGVAYQSDSAYHSEQFLRAPDEEGGHMPSGEDPVLKELQDIKRLIIIALINGGLPQDKVATALGINQSTISRLLSPEKKPSRHRS